MTEQIKVDFDKIVKNSGFSEIDIELKKNYLNKFLENGFPNKKLENWKLLKSKIDLIRERQSITSIHKMRHTQNTRFSKNDMSDFETTAAEKQLLKKTSVKNSKILKRTELGHLQNA